jgi:DNA-binding MarR family transcriptional regulator
MTSSTGQITSARLSERELVAWRGLLRVHASLIKELDAELEREHGLPLTSYEVLLHLDSTPDRRMRMSELAESVVLSRSGVTRLVDRLERDGLIERASCPSDARGSFAVLTDRGRRALRDASGTHLRGIRERFIAQFSPAELEQLAGFWERLLPGAGDGEGACGAEA